MNAYELADELDNWKYDIPRNIHLKLSNMLRQQADRIAELEKQSYRQNHEGFSTIIDKTAPQTKPLSDEEIETIWMKRPANCAEDVLRFARAIEAKVRGEK